MDRRASGVAPSFMTATLALAAFLFVGARGLLALGTLDTDALESPLLLSVARQLVVGPWELYGPYGEQNPLVLIHAPLYYHLAALVALPLHRAGLDPVSAARMAGRAVSSLGLLATLGAAHRMARLGGGPARAGWWAVLLVAGAPALEGVPFAVRPDLLGVALQSTAAGLVLQALLTQKPRTAVVVGAFAMFGLALCVKQQYLATPVASTGLLVWAWRQCRVERRQIELGLLVAASIVVAVYLLEGLLTGGRMWQAVFVAASHLGQVHPAGWLHVATVAAAVVGKEAGLIAVLLAAGLASLPAGQGLIRLLFRAGCLVTGSIAALLIVQLVVVRPWVSGPLLAAVLSSLIFIIPACAAVSRRSIAGSPIDAALWALCAGELVLALALSRITTGAWINYAIQAVVFLAVITARALERAAPRAPQFGALAPAVLAALAVLAATLMDIKELASRRRAARAALEPVLAYAGRSSSALYFSDEPGLNRVYGRLDLVFDDWLYPVFESLGLAEPRARWLRAALATGPVRVVVLESDNPRVDGIPDDLPALGYERVARTGRFVIWRR
jgi:hypothetical protein